MTTNRNIVWQPSLITRADREQRAGHRAAVLWFTGLSGSGKSTLSHAVEEHLYQRQCRTFVLDGDNVRHGLCSDLGFSIEDRTENIRRVGEAARLFTEAGLITLTAFISPLRSDRDRVRAMFAPGDFYEIHCAANLDVCETRDIKGLYQRARAGQIADFTGISSPYEAPLNPEIVAPTGEESIAHCVEMIIARLEESGVLG